MAEDSVTLACKVKREAVIFDLLDEQILPFRHPVAMRVQLRIESLRCNNTEFIGVHDLEDPPGAKISIINCQTACEFAQQGVFFPPGISRLGSEP
jgi:hypothetical protein